MASGELGQCATAGELQAGRTLDWSRVHLLWAQSTVTWTRTRTLGLGVTWLQTGSRLRKKGEKNHTTVATFVVPM